MVSKWKVSGIVELQRSRLEMDVGSSAGNAAMQLLTFSCLKMGTFAYRIT